MRALPIAAAILMMLSLSHASGHAADPVTTFHRTAVQDKADDGQFLGRSTFGRFVVHLPIAFNDVTITTRGTNVGDVVIHAIGARSADDFKFTAMATERTPEMLDADVRNTLVSMGGGAQSHIRTERKDGVELHSAHFERTPKSAYVLTAKTSDRFFTLVCEYPNEQAAVAKALCSDFFGSLKIH